MNKLKPKKKAFGAKVLAIVTLFSLSVAALPISTGFSKLNTANAATGIEQEEQAFLSLINAYRSQNGLGALKISSAITTAFRTASQN